MIAPAPSNDTRTRIVDAARELMFASSYTDVGVAAICERAGVRKGSFYHFFPSKQELTLAVVESHYAAAKAGLLDAAFRADVPPLARLTRLSELAYTFQAELKQQTGHVLGCPFGNLASELSTQDEAIRVAVAAVMARLADLLEQTLEEAKADGSLGDAGPAETAQAMLAYFEGVMLMAKTRNDTEVIRQLLPAMTAIRVAAGTLT